MRWFKHLSGSGDDQLIMDAVSLFGPDGYYVYFRILEIMADEFDIENPGENTFLVKSLRKKLQISFKKTLKILRFFAEKKRIFWELSGNGRGQTIHLNCPKLKELCDNWTKRQLGSEDGVDSDATTRLEAEVEEEVDKKNKEKPEPFVLPSDEIINESSIPMLKTQIGKVCEELYKTKVFSKTHAFSNKCLKQKCNPRAILHTLIRIFNAKPSDPWAYAVQIMKIEDGKFNARDFQKTP